MRACSQPDTIPSVQGLLDIWMECLPHPASHLCLALICSTELIHHAPHDVHEANWQVDVGRANQLPAAHKHGNMSAQDVQLMDMTMPPYQGTKRCTTPRPILMCTPSGPESGNCLVQLESVRALLHDSLAVAAHKGDAGVDKPVKELLQALLPCSSYAGWQLRQPGGAQGPPADLQPSTSSTGTAWLSVSTTNRP